MYRRLPMGIKSAPEMYQRAIEEILQGIDNQATIFDDVLLYSSQLEAHCKVLRRTLGRAREKDLTFALASVCLHKQKLTTLDTY